jgi:hypothetical protein
VLVLAKKLGEIVHIALSFLSAEVGVRESNFMNRSGAKEQ